MGELRIEGFGTVTISDDFLDLDEASRQEVIRQIIEREENKIPLISKEEMTTKEEVIEREAKSHLKQAPGYWAGARTGFALAPPHPVTKGLGLVIGGGIGGEATERAINAITPPKSWDDGVTRQGNTLRPTKMDQFKNLIHDFTTGQWDDW